MPGADMAAGRRPGGGKCPDERVRPLCCRILQGIPDPVLFVDNSGRLLWWNRAAIPILPLAFREAQPAPQGNGSPLNQPAPLVPRHNLVLARAIRGERLNGVKAVLRDSKHSTQLTVSVHTMPASDGEGPQGTVILLRRGPTRRLRRAGLECIHDYFRYLVEHSSDVITVVDKSGTILYQSPSLYRATGHKPQERLGKKAFDLIHPDDQPATRAALAAAFRRRGRVQIAEFRVRHKNGAYRVFEGVAGRLPDSDTAAVIVSSRDITERKAVERELQGSREQLRLLAAFLERGRETERTEIARDIHDQLGQELTVASIRLSQVAKHIAAGDGKETLLKELETVRMLLNGTIRSVQRIGASLRPAILDHFGLPEAIQWQAEEFGRQTGIRMVFETRARRIQASKELVTAVYRIYQEILTNVARHAAATEVHTRIGRKAGRLVLEVADNGKGLKEEQLKSRVSLGILGMKERAALLGGEIAVSGKEGHGTRVTLRLPLTPFRHMPRRS